MTVSVLVYLDDDATDAILLSPHEHPAKAFDIGAASCRSELLHCYCTLRILQFLVEGPSNDHPPYLASPCPNFIELRIPE